MMHMWQCYKCKGRDFSIFHFTDMDSMNKIRIVCSKCGEECFFVGNNNSMMLVPWINPMTKKEEEKVTLIPPVVVSDKEIPQDVLLAISNESELKVLNELPHLTSFLREIGPGSKKQSVKERFPDMAFRKLIVAMLDKYRTQSTITHKALIELVKEVYPKLDDPEKVKSWFVYRLKNEENGLLKDSYANRKHIGYIFKPRVSIADKTMR